MAPKHNISDDDEDGEGPSSCSVAIDNFLKRRHPDSKSTNPFDNMSGLAIRQKKPRLDLPVNAAGSAKLHDPVTEPDNSSSSSHDSSAILASSQQSSSSQCSPSSFRPFRTLLEFYNDIGARRWSCGNRRLLPEVEHEPYLDWNVRRMKFPDWETELKWITRGHLHEMTFEVLVDRLGFNTFLRSVDKHYRDIGVRRLGTEAVSVLCFLGGLVHCK